MADTTEVKVVVDEEALRAKVEEVTAAVKAEAAAQLIAAANLLNPTWLDQRDKLVAEQAVADYRAGIKDA